jgi:hypothetical protein
MYLLLLLLFILAICITVSLSFIKKWYLYRDKVFSIIYQIILFYLCLQLLKYGADKIFKNQFYLPEPNTLFTPVGFVEKDLLYWSTMGASYGYNIFLGTLEMLAAVLVFVKRTRLAGLLLSLGILLNIVAVNFCFDISVKLFSLFLLYLNLYLLLPYRYRVYQLLFLKTIAPAATGNGIELKKSFITYFFQWFAAGIICLEVFYPFIQKRNFNDDTAPRPYLHGVYRVTGYMEGNDTLAAINAPVKRFFIHRDNYIIFQTQQDSMFDYKLGYDTAHAAFVLTDYQFKQTTHQFTYQPADSILTLQYFNNGKETKLVGKAINWRTLPLLSKGFHWTADDIK